VRIVIGGIEGMGIAGAMEDCFYPAAGSSERIGIQQVAAYLTGNPTRSTYQQTVAGLP
jgi:hypothetical protein